MASTTACLGPSSSSLPTIIPHLMPFHIQHTGSAPLSTYFIVKNVSQPGTIPSLTQSIKARFTSTFRGRKMQGLSVNLPDGYSGVMLQTDELGTAGGKDTAPKKRLLPAPPPKARGQKSRRTTRSSIRNNEANGMGDDVDVAVEGETQKGENGMIRTLRPTAKFLSFTLWNPDVDVDEGRDEYLRALSEYQQLSAEV